MTLRSTCSAVLTLRDVDLEDLFAPAHVGLVDQHLPVEPARPHQRRVEHLWTVGRGHDDDALPRVEAVHLRQELVERLLAFLVAPHRRLDPDFPERVELIDEDDARGLVLGLVEEIADSRGTNTDEHLDKLRAAQTEKGHAGFTGDRTRQQGLAGPRRADEEHALGNPAADARVFFWILEELDDLAQFFFGLVDARHVAELDLDVVFFRVDLGAAARERHDATFRATDPAKEKAPEGDQEDQGKDPSQHFGDPAVGDGARVFDAVLLELFDELGILDADRHKCAALALIGLQHALNAVFSDGDFLDFTVADAGLELAVRDLFAGPQRQERRIADGEQQQDAQHEPHGRAWRGARRKTPPARVGRIRGTFVRHLEPRSNTDGLRATDNTDNTDGLRVGF